MKKGFIVFMALAMILSYGVVFTGNANAASDGDLIKMDGSSAVYYLNGGKRYVFPNQKTFMTWYPNFDSVVTVSQSEMEGYPLGGNVTYRPGTRLVKITTVPTVYAVEPGGVLRSILSEANAEALYGSAWNTMIDDVPDSFFVNYTVGADLTPGMYPTGTLVKEEGSATTYYIDGTTRRPIATGEAFDANNFNWSYLVTTSSLTGYTDGTSITGAEAGLTTVAGSGGSGTTAANSVDVALSSSTAVATTVISDTADSSQALIPFVTVNFTAPSSGDVTVTNLKFKRTGISADTDINNTYLYDGITRLAEGGSVSSGVVTFNDATGLFTVPAGTTKAVTFKVDLTYNTSAGKTMAFELTEVTTANSATVNGSLPLKGNTMTTASVTDLGNVNITNGDTPSGGSDVNVDPGEKDYEVYKITLQANDQDLQLEYLKLTLVGSVDVDDLENIKLTKGGTTLATGVINSDREVIFDLTNSPYAITKGQNPTFSVRADIVSGSTRDFKFSVEYSSDLVLKDTNYDVYITPFGSGSWTAKKSSNKFSINSGSLAVSLDTSSPTDNVASDATNVKLATYRFEATGEDIKVSNLDLNVNTTSGIEGGLNNGKIFLDGVQVGTTKDLTEATDVNFTFGSSFIIPAGESKLVDVYADIKTTTSTTISSGDITVTLKAGSSNAQGQSSLTSISAPSSDTAANTLSVSAGSLTLIKYSAYGDQNIVKPSTQAKIASFVVTAGAYEGVSVDTINISAATSGVMQNMKLYDGSTQIGSTKTTLTSGSTTENVFSVNNLDLAAGESKVIDVYADIKSSTGANTVTITVDLAGTTAITSTAVTATDQPMQTMTITTGSIASAADGSQPDSAIVIAGTTATMNAVKFTASNEAFTINKVRITQDGSNSTNSVGKVIISYEDKDGNTITKEGYLNSSNYVNFYSMGMYVPKDDTAVLTIKAEFPTIASGADSGDVPALGFDKDNDFSATGESSNTVLTQSSSSGITNLTDVFGNVMVVRKTVPTITLVSLPTTVLNDGTQVISKFSIAADAAADVYFKELNWTYATTTGVDVTDSTIYLYKNSDQSTALNSAESLTKDGSNSLEVVLSSEETIAAGTSVTYVLKGDITGSATNRSFSTKLKSSASTATAGTSTTYNLLKLYETGGILWSDGSVTPHSSSSADYADCTYVKNLPTDSQTLSK